MKRLMLLLALVASPAAAQSRADCLNLSDVMAMRACLRAGGASPVDAWAPPQRAANPLMQRQYYDDRQAGIGVWLCRYADGQMLTVRSTGQCPLDLAR